LYRLRRAVDGPSAEPLRCSFYAKPTAQVQHLIIADHDNTNICDECVELCNWTIAQRAAAKAKEAEATEADPPAPVDPPGERHNDQCQGDKGIAAVERRGFGGELE
jgi:hypothetical protein